MNAEEYARRTTHAELQLSSWQERVRQLEQERDALRAQVQRQAEGLLANRRALDREVNGNCTTWCQEEWRCTEESCPLLPMFNRLEKALEATKRALDAAQGGEHA